MLVRTLITVIIVSYVKIVPSIAFTLERSSSRVHQREIHQTIQELQENGLPNPQFQSTTHAVIDVLSHWSESYLEEPEWNSLLNKANLKQEVEESIVALHYLLEWQRNSPSCESFLALDACCGKGLFSTLLSYLAPPGLTRIILFDKDPNVNWSHILAANRNHKEEGRPFLEAWPGINLHDHDALVETLLAYNTPIAVTGIHLCKTLSPALIGLVNALGPERAPHLCLAPCCLPRREQHLQIPLYQGPLQRQARRMAANYRAQARQRSGSCLVCQGSHHVKDCPQRQHYSTEEEWNRMVLSQQFCRNCGRPGHKKADCTRPPIQVPEQPSTILAMSSLVYPSEPEPSLRRYCEALGEVVQLPWTMVVDSGLTTAASHGKEKKSNWNRNRKSLFLVATAHE